MAIKLLLPAETKSRAPSMTTSSVMASSQKNRTIGSGSRNFFNIIFRQKCDKRPNVKNTGRPDRKFGIRFISTRDFRMFTTSKVRIVRGVRAEVYYYNFFFFEILIKFIRKNFFFFLYIKSSHSELL